MNEEAKKRITAYYELLAQKENKSLAAKTMKNLVGQLSEEDTIIYDYTGRETCQK